MNIISTSQLIKTISSEKRKLIEAKLLLNGCYATHFLTFSGTYLYDEGIDGEVRKTNFWDFGKWYSDAYWIIDQIV
jgi:hypothetical protein